MAGQRFLGSGGLLYLKDSTFASKYTAGQNTLYNSPKVKNTFFVKFHVPAQVQQVIGADNNRILDLTFAVKSADIPSTSYDTEILNEYNRKRVVQTGVRFEPLKMSFYDDKRSTALGIMDDYHKYYYADSRDTLNSRAKWVFEPATPMTIDNNKSFGYKYKRIKFFDKITIFRLDSKRHATVWDCFNPILTQIEYDNVDYGDYTPAMVNISMEYEGYIMPFRYAPIDSILADINYQGLQPILDVVDTYNDYYDILDYGSGIGSLLQQGGLDMLKDFATDGKINAGSYLNDAIIQPIKETATSTLSSFGNFLFG